MIRNYVYMPKRLYSILKLGLRQTTHLWQIAKVNDNITLNINISAARKVNVSLKNHQKEFHLDYETKMTLPNFIFVSSFSLSTSVIFISPPPISSSYLSTIKHLQYFTNYITYRNEKCLLSIYISHPLQQVRND